MFYMLISAPNYEVYPCFLFYYHITTLLVLPHITALYYQNTQLMQGNTFIEDFNQTGVVAKLSSIPMFLVVLRSHPGVHARVQ